MAKQQLDRRYVAALEKATDVIFEYATYQMDWDWDQLADEAGLCRATVHRLGNRITQLPRWQTFWKMATACGLEMQFVALKSQQKMIAGKIKRLKLHRAA